MIVTGAWSSPTCRTGAWATWLSLSFTMVHGSDWPPWNRLIYQPGLFQESLREIRVGLGSWR